MNSLHWKSLELHGPLVEQVVVGVAVEDDPVVVRLIRHQLDVDSVLLEEISSFESACLAELSIVGPRSVEIGIFLGTLLEAAKDEDVSAGDLERAHIKLSLRKFQVEELPAVLTLREAFNAGAWLQLAVPLLSQATEAVKSAAIVEEAQGGVELRLTKLGESLPDILGYDVAFTVPCCLVLVDLATSDENLGEVGVDSEPEA